MLTKKEYQITEILALRKGSALSKEAILNHLYSRLDEPNPKIIDVFICKICKKLKMLWVHYFIEANWVRGYMVIDHFNLTKLTAQPASGELVEAAQAGA